MSCQEDRPWQVHFLKFSFAEEVAPSQRKGALYKPTSRFPEVTKEKVPDRSSAGLLGAYPGEGEKPVG